MKSVICYMISRWVWDCPDCGHVNYEDENTHETETVVCGECGEESKIFTGEEE